MSRPRQEPQEQHQDQDQHHDNAWSRRGVALYPIEGGPRRPPAQVRRLQRCRQRLRQLLTDPTPHHCLKLGELYLAVAWPKAPHGVRLLKTRSELFSTEVLETIKGGPRKSRPLWERQQAWFCGHGNYFRAALLSSRSQAPVALWPLPQLSKTSLDRFQTTFRSRTAVLILACAQQLGALPSSSICCMIG